RPQLYVLRELKNPNLSKNRAAQRQRTTRSNCNLPWGSADRLLGLREHWLAGLCNEQSTLRTVEVPGTRVSNAIPRLDCEKSFAFNSKVKRVALPLQRSLGGTQSIATEQSVFIYREADLRRFRFRIEQDRAEVRALGAIARR